MKHSLRTKLSLTIALIMLLTVASISFLSNILIAQTSHIIIEQNHRKSDVANIKIA